MKNHRGRSRLHANRGSAGCHWSIVEAIVEPRLDVLDKLNRVCIVIFIRQDSMFPVRLDHNPLLKWRPPSRTGNPVVSGIYGGYREELIVRADDRQQ